MCRPFSLLADGVLSLMLVIRGRCCMTECCRLMSALSLVSGAQRERCVYSQETTRHR